MAVFTSLPIDIIRIILHFFDDYIGSELGAAKVIIPLLAVCHEWRTIVVPMFYCNAFFSSFNIPGYTSMPWSYRFLLFANIDIILQNGYGGYVKSMKFNISDKYSSVKCLLHMARMLGISSKTCPELKSLMDYDGKKSKKPMDWDNMKHVSAAATIATTFASKFPNIKQLKIISSGSHGIISCFTSALTDCFANQLVEFRYRGAFNFSNKQPMLGLEVVCLCFTDNNEGQNHLIICPRSIKKLFRVTCGTTFDWEIFSTEQSPDAIVFEKLEHLDCMEIFPNGASDDTNITRKLHFPSIKEMDAFNCRLGTSVIANQLRSGLQKLTYVNEQQDMLNLIQLDLSGLVNLTLVLCKPSHPDLEGEFLEFTNTLFSQLNAIPTVEAKFIGDISSLNSADVYWPNLTRVVFDMSNAGGNIFEFALSISDLIYLEINGCTFDSKIIDCALTRFKNLHSDYFTTRFSKKATLRLWVAEKIHINEFKSVLRMLKWYWPKSKNIQT